MLLVKFSALSASWGKLYIRLQILPGVGYGAEQKLLVYRQKYRRA
jgi:hypothetical protein